MRISDIRQYPVKGLGGVRLDHTVLRAGHFLPGDRQFAITNGHPKHDQLPAGTWMQKAFFLQLMKFDVLAELSCTYDGQIVTILRNGEVTVSADPDDPAGIKEFETFFSALTGAGLDGTPRLTRINEGAYTDTNAPWISLGGTASVDRFAEVTGTAPDARRFRLNIMLDTADPFEEASLIGHMVRMGGAVLRVVEPVGRCAAIDVDPETAVRGPHYLPAMKLALGHTNLGIFAEIIEGGHIAVGDRIETLS